MYLDPGFAIAPVISNSLLLGSQDMGFMDNMPQLSTSPIYTDMSITTEPQSSITQVYTDNMSITTDKHFTETSILEQVINSYKGKIMTNDRIYMFLHTSLALCNLMRVKYVDDSFISE